MSIQTQSTTGVEISSYHLHYHGNALFSDFNATFAKGCCHAILGKSGAGKSSLLKALAQELVPGTFSFMTQHDTLLPWLNVARNVRLTKQLASQTRAHFAYESKLAACLEEVGLGGKEKCYPYELSGGMRRRVALARMLYEDAQTVLLDEPFAAVDAITRWQLQCLLAKKLKGKTVIVVTHDPMEALTLADQIYLLAGMPVKLIPLLSLESAAPRELDDTQVIAGQKKILEALATC